MTILGTATTDTSTASLVRIIIKAVFKIIFGVKKNRNNNKKPENKNIITSKQKYYNQNLFLKIIFK